MPLEKTLERIEQDIAAGDYGKARDRLHGLIATYPDDFSLRRTLGDVYWQLQYPAMSGRYWYLEENKSPDMVTACEVFERSCGNNPFHILLALKYRGDIQTSGDTFAGRTLLALQQQVKDQYGYCIDFKKRGAERYQWMPAPKRVWQERLVLTGCIVVTFAILGLIGIGLETVWKWIF